MLNDNFVTFEIGKAKHIALVAHDGKKKELIEWCDKNKEILKGHFLCGTGTTARLIAEKTGLPVKGYNSVNTINFFRRSLRNSACISLSNSFSSCDFFEIVL